MFMAFHGFPNSEVNSSWPWRPWPQASSAQGRRGWSASRNVVIWWCFRFQWDEPWWTMLNYRSWTWSNPVFCLQNSIWPKYHMKSGRTWTVDYRATQFHLSTHVYIQTKPVCLTCWCWDVMTDAKGSVGMRVQVGFYVASRNTEWVDQIASPLPCQNRSRVNSLLLLHVQTPRVTFFSQDFYRVNANMWRQRAALHCRTPHLRSSEACARLSFAPFPLPPALPPFRGDKYDKWAVVDLWKINFRCDMVWRVWAAFWVFSECQPFCQAFKSFPLDISCWDEREITGGFTIRATSNIHKQINTVYNIYKRTPTTY